MLNRDERLRQALGKLKGRDVLLQIKVESIRQGRPEPVHRDNSYVNRIRKERNLSLGASVTPLSLASNWSYLDKKEINPFL